MTRDIDNPAREAAERAYATEVSGIALVSKPKRPELPYVNLVELVDLSRQIGQDWLKSAERTVQEAETIRSVVLEVAPRLVELDPEAFPEVPVIKRAPSGESTESTMRLLEVPHSRRILLSPAEVLSYNFTARVTYITPDGTLTDFAVARCQKGKKVAYARQTETTSPEDVVNLRNDIFRVLHRASYKRPKVRILHRQSSPLYPEFWK